MDANKRLALDRLVQNGYVPTIQDLAKSLTAPFWWHDDFDADEIVRNPRRTVRHNGTMTFLNTGEKIIGVTADHVYAAYLRDASAQSTLVCQIGGATLDPQRHLIDRDSRLDLATFELSEVLVNASRSNVHSATTWPPSLAAKGTLAIVGGWPGSFRDERPGELDAHFASFITRIDEASPDRLGIVLNLAEGFASGRIVLPASPDLGGASGGPVFSISDVPLVSLSIAGFIYEYHQSYEIVFARHACAVRADGALVR